MAISFFLIPSRSPCDLALKRTVRSQTASGSPAFKSVGVGVAWAGHSVRSNQADFRYLHREIILLGLCDHCGTLP